MVGNQNKFFNFQRTKFGFGERVNQLDKLEVKSQAEKTKNSTSWSRETPGRSLLLNELQKFYAEVEAERGQPLRWRKYIIFPKKVMMFSYLKSASIL